MQLKKSIYLLLAFIILFIAFVASKYSNTLTGTVTRLIEVTDRDDALFEGKLTSNEINFIVNLIKQSEINPVYKSLQILNSGGELGKIKEILGEYPIYIRSLSLEDRYRAVQELHSVKDLFPQDRRLFPEKVVLNSDQIIAMHGEKATDGIISEIFYQYFVSVGSSLYELFIVGNVGSIASFDGREAYLYNNEAYVKIDQTDVEVNAKISSKLEKQKTRSLITGHQIYNPPTAFNQHQFDVAVLVPYNSTYPLPSNYQAFLQPILNNVKQYFLDNSDNQTWMNFTVYPVFYPNLNVYSVFPPNIVNAGDPIINYALYDFATIILPYQYCCNGAASMWITSSGPQYLNTNDGPIPWAFAIIWSNFIPEPYRTNELFIEHEIGHILTFWHPQITSSVFNGYVPHARGILHPSDCVNLGNIIQCAPYEYGDYLDVMGTGRGSYHYHEKAFYMGLSPVSRVQIINNPGIYNLCDLQHNPPAGCPQELLVNNPVGNNLALELRTNSGPEAFYNCPSNYFDGVLVRVSDIEQGGILNNTMFNSSAYGGDVLLPYGYSYTNCSNFPLSLLDYFIKPGEVMQTPLGFIEVQSITNLASGGKQAVVNFTLSYPGYIPPLGCYLNPPSGGFYPAPNPYVSLYSNTLWIIDEYSSQYFIFINNNDVCINQPNSEVFLVNTTIPGLGASATILSAPINASNYGYATLPTPITLMNLLGLFPFTLTVSKVSDPNQNFSLTNTFNLVPYVPEIYGPYGVSNCNDFDAIPFTWQNLGANYSSNLGANVTLNPAIPGLTNPLYVPDICTSGRRASDVVCGINTGIPGIQSSAFFVIQDCRYVTNYLGSGCILGGCT